MRKKLKRQSTTTYQCNALLFRRYCFTPRLMGMRAQVTNSDFRSQMIVQHPKRYQVCPHCDPTISKRLTFQHMGSNQRLGRSDTGSMAASDVALDRKPTDT